MADETAAALVHAAGGFAFELFHDKQFRPFAGFDKDLARDLSRFITGPMHVREKIPHTTRRLITLAALTVLSCL